MNLLDRLTEYVRWYAREHYEDGGWDVIEECWDDAQILDVLTEAGATDEDEALAAVSGFVSVMADRQADARNSRF